MDEKSIQTWSGKIKGQRSHNNGPPSFTTDGSRCKKIRKRTQHGTPTQNLSKNHDNQTIIHARNVENASKTMEQGQKKQNH